MFILTEPEERQLFLNSTILSYPMTVLDASADRISSKVPRVGGAKTADILRAALLDIPGRLGALCPWRSRSLLTP